MRLSRFALRLACPVLALAATGAGRPAFIAAAMAAGKQQGGAVR